MKRMERGHNEKAKEGEQAPIYGNFLIRIADCGKIGERDKGRVIVDYKPGILHSYKSDKHANTNGKRFLDAGWNTSNN